MTNSKRKGKTGELELSKILRSYGYNCRRSVQYNGRAPEGAADLTGLPGIHIEVKRVQAGYTAIHEAMDQAIRDKKSPETIPSVFHRQNRRPWLVTMRLDDWIAMYACARLYGLYIFEETEGENAEEKK